MGEEFVELGINCTTMRSYVESGLEDMTVLALGDHKGNEKSRLTVIAGPCVLEGLDMALEVGAAVKDMAENIGFDYIFKSSFDKANRTHLASFRGPGLEAGLEMLAEVKRVLGVPVLTDVHEPEQAASVAAVADVLQIPAFLCRQSDLIAACGATGKVVNIKKGQFMAPADMRFAVEKARVAGAKAVWLTERGTFFGYGDLVVDMRSLSRLAELNVPVVFDATHSVQQPGLGGGVTKGRPQDVPALARAAVAVGIDALFVETHPNPSVAKSDAGSQFPLGELEGLLASVVVLHRTVQSG